MQHHNMWNKMKAPYDVWTVHLPKHENLKNKMGEGICCDIGLTLKNGRHVSYYAGH